MTIENFARRMKIKVYVKRLVSTLTDNKLFNDESDLIEYLDEQFYNDFCSKYIDLDYNDNHTRDIFRSEAKLYYTKNIKNTF